MIVVQATYLLDGTEINKYSLEGLRREMGFVLQDTMLFFGSVRDNIAYGRPGARNEEIIEAAKQANADEFIMKLPKGYHTMIGERGITLSGGERQRIGIARALIRNAAILILDEPTASLDVESEKNVIEAIERLMRGRTIITISHKLDTIIPCDKIFVMKEGRIAGEGTHQSLLEDNYIYAELYRIYNESKIRNPAATK